MPENDTPRAPIYPLLTPAEAARRLGISKRTVNRMVADGRMPAIRITAATYRIRPDVIDNLMALTTFVGKAPAAFEERFWRYVDKSGDCWVWAGATNGRYGKISRGVGLGVVGAHRASWEIHFGPIPPDTRLSNLNPRQRVAPYTLTSVKPSGHIFSPRVCPSVLTLSV